MRQSYGPHGARVLRHAVVEQDTPWQLIYNNLKLYALLWKVGAHFVLNTKMKLTGFQTATFRVLGVRLTGALEKNGSLLVASHH
jgi:hypothetical protein